MRIGFIGIGNIGFPMAERLLLSGHKVLAFDLQSAQVDRLVARGARAAASVMDVANLSDLVFLSLPGPVSATEVLTGEQGLIATRGARYVVDLSTIGSPIAKRVAAALRTVDVTYVDSPVSGGPAPAAKGKLTIMTACTDADFATVKPYLDPLGSAFHVGQEPGMAQMMKLVNNILSATAMAISCEAIGLGRKAGLDPALMVKIASSGTGRNSALQDKFPAAILPRTFDWGFTAGMMCKDLRLGMQEAEAMGMPMMVATAVRQMWQVVSNEMGPESDITMMMKLVENWGAIASPAE